MKQNDLSTGFLIDQETKVDYLNNEAIAKTIVKLINGSTDKPMTIGVHGDWGAGKSSILEMIEQSFQDKDQILCLKFNGWQFQGFEDAKIAVIEGIVNQLIEKRSLFTKASDEVKNILRRIDWLKVAKKTGGLAFTAFTGIPTGDQLKSVIDSAKDLLSDPSQLATKENVTQAAEFFSGILKDGARRSLPKEIHEFRKAFEKLMEKAGIERLVVLIDDLDRCLPETAIETLEAIRLFVFLPKTAFVVGADEAMIEYSVRHHFPDLPESNSSIGYARNYLEKLIQVPMRIPALGETETHIYVTLLLIGTVLGESSQEFDKILQLGRAALKKPWEGNGISLEDIKTAVNNRYDEITSQIILANQIAPMLSTGTKGNPRQIKRFINALNLRLQTSIERGFGSAINQDYLAKLMLAELFLPNTFEHIASTVANVEDGICPEIRMLEIELQSKQKPLKKQPSNSKEPEEDNAEKSISENNAIIADWKLKPEVMKWISMEPMFKEKSLKPYLFVIKDRKNYLGTSAPLSPKLHALLEKLMGGEANAKTVSNDLKQLLPIDVDTLFKALHSKLQVTENLSTKPVVMYGVNELVLAQPSLQLRYVEMLAGLPVNKIGVWSMSGYEKIITQSEAKAKLQSLKESWGAKNSALKKAMNSFGGVN